MKESTRDMIFVIAFSLVMFWIGMGASEAAEPYAHESRLTRVLIVDAGQPSGFYDSSVDPMDIRGSLEWSDWGAYMVFRACLTTNLQCWEDQAELLFRQIIVVNGTTAWIRAFNVRTGADVEFQIGLWIPGLQQVFGSMLDEAFVLFFEEE